MKLYVIRHGETDKNKNRVIADILEDINENGIKQAKIAGNILKNIKIDLVICSPAKRTRHTLDLLNIKNLKIKFDDRLIERDVGIYENEKFDNLDWNLFWNYYDTKYTELESMKSVFQRTSNLLDELRAEYGDINILLITHGGVSRTIYWYVNGVPTDGNVPIDIGNCEIMEYEF